MPVLQPGATVWLPNPSSAASEPPFSLAEVLETPNDQLVRVKFTSGASCGTEKLAKMEDVNLANFKSSSESTERSEADNCNLLELSEATLLHNTLLRYDNDQIYTFTGQIVTSVNPCKPLPHLYSTESMQAARDRESARERRPHIFAVAETAYTNLRELQRNQSIVVTGISGAGKTEANKYLLRFLCWRVAAAADERGAATGGSDFNLPKMAQVVLKSNPVFESFGNATTVNNSNSSRFGKFTKLFFGEESITGASISTYLLEKSRLAVQQAGEANFHIFYQMLLGLDAQTLSALQLTNAPSSFAFLDNKAMPDRATLNDADEFKTTDTAMRELDLRPDEVYRLLAGLLHLGNVRFDVRHADDVDRAAKVSNASAHSLAAAESLLGISMLGRALTSHSVQAGGGRKSFHEVSHTPELATRSRDALAKRVYERLFGWLVRKMNGAVSVPSSEAPAGVSGPPSPARSLASTEALGEDEQWIGLLDIFGFEIFAENSLEQLLINLANEKLQRFFLDAIFRHEQALYVAEEIEWVEVAVPDNEAIMAAIEQRPHGLLSILDEQCRLGERGSDEALCLQLNQKNALCMTHVANLDQKGRSRFNIHTHFSLNHFVAPVEYTAAAFLEKNRDTLYLELANALTGSESALVQSLFPPAEGGATTAAVRVKGSGKSYASVSTVFTDSLSQLLNELGSTDAGFVRCIKPNQGLVPGDADGRMVLQQLRSCGMLQAVKMIRSMFPSRIPYDDIASRLLPPLKDESLDALPPRAFCESVCGAYDVDFAEYRLGKTRIFFKAGSAVALNKLCRAPMAGDEGVATAVVLRVKLKLYQRECNVVEMLHGWMARAMARKGGKKGGFARRASLGSVTSLGVVIPEVHAYRALRRAYVVWLVRERAATRMQKAVRGRLRRCAYEEERRCAVAIQRAARGTVAKRAYEKVRASSTAMQAASRRMFARRALVRAIAAATAIAAAARRRATLVRYARCLRAVRTIQHAWRQHRYFRTAALLQSVMRRFPLRMRFSRWHARGRPALVRAQAILRGRAPRETHLLMVAAARQVQATWRMVRIQRLQRTLVASALQLQIGLYALKFPQKTGASTAAHEPHWRYVWLSPDMKHMCWARVDMDKVGAAMAKRKQAKKAEKLRPFPTEAPAKSIPMSAISAIADGAKTGILKKMEGRQERNGTIAVGPFGNKSLELHEECCFSIISATRHLDLMAQTTAERDAFMAALQAILVHASISDTAKELSHGARQRRATPGFKPAHSSGLQERIDRLGLQINTLEDTQAEAKAELSALRQSSARTPVTSPVRFSQNGRAAAQPPKAIVEPAAAPRRGGKGGANQHTWLSQKLARSASGRNMLGVNKSVRASSPRANRSALSHVNK
uniref:Myosin motor domain-containing protein n=5 Tax=Chrysotila carterae TaxID=13221 RepID=A0A7S4BGF0_CHRCT